MQSAQGRYCQIIRHPFPGRIRNVACCTEPKVARCDPLLRPDRSRRFAGSDALRRRKRRCTPGRKTEGPFGSAEVVVKRGNTSKRSLHRVRIPRMPRIHGERFGCAVWEECIDRVVPIQRIAGGQIGVYNPPSPNTFARGRRLVIAQAWVVSSAGRAADS